MKKIYLTIGAIGVILVIYTNSRLLFKSISQTNEGGNTKQTTSLKDVHGLSVDVTDSSKVWLASHTGLYLLKDDKDLSAVGDKRDDYMGFSQHPTDSSTLFTSGHPSTGGNIGFQKSTDAGNTWQKVSDGANGPVDFHAVAVDQIDPTIMYGYYKGQLQRSTNSGKDWQISGTTFQDNPIISLTTSPSEKDTLYAATKTGLLISRSQGQVWAQLSTPLENDVVMAVALNPKNVLEIMAYGQKLGLAKSTDGGATWVKINSALASSPVLYISYDRNKPGTVYAINQALEIYKSIDNSIIWDRVY